MVHTAECPFEVLIGCVDVTFGEFSVLIHHYVCGEAVVYTSVCAESIGGITQDAHGFRGMCAYVCEDGRPEFEDGVHKGNGSIVRGVIRVFLVGLVYECCGAGAPGCRGVAEPGHDISNSGNA